MDGDEDEDEDEDGDVDGDVDGDEDGDVVVSSSVRVAALYVDPKGPYVGREDVDAWTEQRDARLYAGPWPVVAHPPCQRWGRFWWRGVLGADEGCFEAALRDVRLWGGVLEHPEGSLAWPAFGLPVPVFGAGWTSPGLFDGGRSCAVDQGNYGHRARKRTWLYYVGKKPPELDWSHGPAHMLVAANERSRRLGLQVIDRRRTTPDPPRVRGSARAPRCGVEVMTKAERRLTPPAFAEVLAA